MLSSGSSTPRDLYSEPSPLATCFLSLRDLQAHAVSRASHLVSTDLHATSMPAQSLGGSLPSPSDGTTEAAAEPEAWRYAPALARRHPPPKLPTATSWSHVTETMDSSFRTRPRKPTSSLTSPRGSLMAPPSNVSGGRLQWQIRAPSSGTACRQPPM